MSENISNSAISQDVTSDRRVMATRESLFAAFGWLMQRKAYEDIRVTDISDRANVVRSTFYEYFGSKGDLLQQSIARPFSVLAACAVGACTPRQLRLTLEHFWDRRALLRTLLTGVTLDRLTRKLSTMIFEQLVGLHQPSHDSQLLRLSAIQSAGGQIALIRAWLSGEIPADIKHIVKLMLESPVNIR
jgi:AcrR family transcriptional regulator